MLKRIPRAVQILLGLVVLALLAMGLYFVPPVHSRLAWRVNNLRASIIYFFHPPQDVTFQPSGQTQSTPTAGLALSSTPSPTIASTPTPLPTDQATLTPTITSTPIPDSVILTNVPFVDQMGRYNYCGPANLTMALEFWGWKGDATSFLAPRDQIAAVIKPGEANPNMNFVDRSQSDVNVMPYEMVDFVNQHTNYKALFRYGGDPDLLKRLIAAGFPVITEKGIYEPLLPENTIQWGGHYALTTGYDDVNYEFVWQDFIYPCRLRSVKTPRPLMMNISQVGALSTTSSSLSILPIMKRCSTRCWALGRINIGLPNMPWILQTRRSRAIPFRGMICFLPCSTL